MNKDLQSTQSAKQETHRKTAVGLFKDDGPVDDVIGQIEALGLPRNEVHVMEEPTSFEVTGVMSFPRIDFETHLARALTTIGATRQEAEAYLKELRHGGAMVFATGPDEKVDQAAHIMDEHGAVGIERGRSADTSLPGVARGEDTTPDLESPVFGGQVGRIPPRGPAYFVW